jgi:hypothetical protein
MLGLRKRIAFTAVLLVGIAPSGSKALTIDECYAIVQQDYANCRAASYYQNFGQCENRLNERMAACSQGVFVPLGASRKDECLNRVHEEYKNCGYRAVCQNRWLQGLQACN